MKKELSAGGIILKYIDGKIHILLIKYKNGLYGFPKGHLEPGETEIQAVRREIKEEVGLENIEVMDRIGAFERNNKNISIFYVKVDNFNHLETTEEEYCWVDINKAPGLMKYEEDSSFLADNLSKIKDSI